MMRQVVRLSQNPRRRPPRSARLIVILAAGALAAAMGGCATWQAPEAVEDPAIRARAVTEAVGDVRLSAAVLSTEESRRFFGKDVNASGVQPVWLEVENATTDALWLLRAGTDPDYFSPLEVAWSFHAALSPKKNAAIDEHFGALDFQNPIPPHSRVGGILFTNPHDRTRVLNVDLLGPAKVIPFTLFLPVPDDPPDETAQEVIQHFSKGPLDDFDNLDAFRDALEGLPCCATNEDGTEAGDPLNLVVVGHLADIAAAVVRRGFRIDRKDFDNAQQLFGRPPDFVMRKTGQDVPAYWLRGWVTRLRYKGQLVFVVQAGRPVGGRFANADAEQLELHPYVDEARNLLIQEMIYSGGLARLGFADGSGSGEPRLQDGRDPRQPRYFSDGLRAVMFFVTRPVALSGVQILDWVPYLERAEREAAARPSNLAP